MKNLGKRIRDRRKELGMTQKELAAAVGLTQGHVSRIEQGKQDLTLSQVRRFERVLGVALTANATEVTTTDLFGIETLYELPILEARSEFDAMLEVIKRAERADFFQVEQNNLRLQFWKAVALRGAQLRSEAKAIYTKIFESGLSSMDFAFQAMVKIEYGHLLEDQHEYSLALEYFHDALNLQRQIPTLQFDLKLMYRLFWGLGTAYAYIGSLEEANAYLRKAAKFAEDALYEANRMHYHTQFTRSAVMILQGMYTEAITLCFEVLEHFDKHSLWREAMMTRNNIAFALKMLGRHEESEEWYQQVLSMANQYPKHVSKELVQCLAEEGYYLPDYIVKATVG
jgi:transcriptional regulator with XRE-family HTH domain